jgi:hypothetical protein
MDWKIIMKTPWSELVNHGVGFAAVVVIAIASIGLMTVVGIGVVINKILIFIK